MNELPIRQARPWPERPMAMVLVLVLAWSLFAAIPTTAGFIAAGGNAFGHWWAFYVPIVLYYYLWAVVSPLVYQLVVRWPFERSILWKSVLAHLVLWVGFTTVSPFIVHSGNWQEWLYGAKAPGFHAMGAFTYSLIVMGCLALKYYRIGLSREREAARLELRSAMLDGQLSLARIDALRMQINPHFLFNALNSIAALVETGRAAEAYRTTELLGGLLRRSLEPQTQNRITLEYELEFVSQYLEIEQIRFGEALRFHTDIQSSTLSIKVPALILQPLVENAIKHAVALSSEPVDVWLSARLEASNLMIEVRDNGPGKSANQPPGAGQGLDNVRQRLRLIHGPDASLACHFDRQCGGSRVVLRIPADGADIAPHDLQVGAGVGH